MKWAATSKNALAMAIGIASLGFSEVTPHNSWRALIVYTNTIDSIYNDSLATGANMYNTYFASLIDGMNDVYEESGVDIRAQLAGVVWDKAYGRADNYLTAYFNLQNQSNGMQRWTSDSILNKYAADVVILVENPVDQYAGGAAFTRGDAIAKNFSGFWVRVPNNLYFIAHESGHNFSTQSNYDHCLGHRMTFDEYGNVMAGPSPDSIPNTIMVAPYIDVANHIVEATPSTAKHGFHTTMAYGDGGSQYCHSQYPPHNSQYPPHTHGGVTRTFSTSHQGAGGDPGGPGPDDDWHTRWTGTYSNPANMWLDSVTNISYPTGFSDSVTYINRLKYIGDPAVTFLTHTKYLRNFSAVLNNDKDFLTQLRSVPSNITVTSDMSLGQYGSDSQWVYAHFAATNSVAIEPGFKVGLGSSLKISVTSPVVLPKGGVRNLEEGAAQHIRGSLPGLKVKYDPASQAVVFSLASETLSKLTVSVYDIKGVQKMVHRSSHGSEKSFSASISVRDLPKGVYVIVVTAGKAKVQQQFVKW
jgi:hypothetical protein